MPATDALVFDAIRTPRGKGKVNGSLHTTKPVDLVVGLMHEMLGRNQIFGNVSNLRSHLHGGHLHF